MTALINNTVHIQVSAFDLITSGNLNKIVLSSPLTTMTLYFYQFYEDGQSFLINRCAIKHDYIHLFFSGRKRLYVLHQSYRGRNVDFQEPIGPR